jgi:hypothetical protein
MERAAGAQARRRQGVSARRSAPNSAKRQLKPAQDDRNRLKDTDDRDGDAGGEKSVLDRRAAFDEVHMLAPMLMLLTVSSRAEASAAFLAPM